MDTGWCFKGRCGGGWCLPSLLNSDFYVTHKGENRNLKATASLVQHHSAPFAVPCLKQRTHESHADGEGVVRANRPLNHPCR